MRPRHIALCVGTAQSATPALATGRVATREEGCRQDAAQHLPAKTAEEPRVRGRLAWEMHGRCTGLWRIGRVPAWGKASRSKRSKCSSSK